MYMGKKQTPPWAQPHLVVEEHVDDGVDNSAKLCQDGGHHAGHGGDQSWPTERGQKGHDAVGHPAQQVAGHHGWNHDQNVLLSSLSCRQVDCTHLDTQRRRGECKEYKS